MNPVMNIASRRPDPTEYGHAEYYTQLISAVEGEDVLSVLSNQIYWLRQLGATISAEQTDRVHAPYRWTIRQVFEHGADAERVFGYRAMSIASGDTAELAPWDENAYADARFGLGGTFAMLIDEWESLRRANCILLRRIEPAAWDRSAIANRMPVSVRAIAWMMAAHQQHHLGIVEQRLGIMVPRKPEGGM